MSLKAAEVGYLLPFALDTLERHGGAAEFGAPLVHAGRSLESLLDIIRRNPCVVPHAERDAMLAAYGMHLRCCGLAFIALTPKHHLTTHMCDRQHVH